MADLVTRMRLDSSEYDQKVKRAAQNLLDFEAQCRATGQSMNTLSQENLDYVRSLGQMNTVSKNARGQINELSQAFTELSMQYKRLSDEEKNGKVGEALSASINQLKGRITELKQNLSDVNTELGDTGKTSKSTGSALDALTSKFGLSVNQVVGWGAAIGAAKVALDVAKDAFFASERNLDEWNSFVESSKSVYQGFLNAINTGDISGFLSNIDSITQAARDAYNALDALSTFNAFNQVNVEKTRTGMTESIVDYREGNGTKEAVRAAGDAYKKELEERRKLEKEAYLAKVREVASQRGVSGDDLIAALSGTYGNYQSLKAQPMTGTRTVYYGGGMFSGGGMYQEAIPANEHERLGQALRQLNDTELQSLQALGAQAERTGNEIAQVDRQLSRVLNGRGGASGGGGGGTRTAAPTTVEGGIKGIKDFSTSLVSTTESLAQLRQQLASFQAARETATNTADYAAAEQGIQLTQRKIGAQEMAIRMGVDTDSILAVEDQMKEELENMRKNLPMLEIQAEVNTDGVKTLAKEGKETKASWQAAAKALSSAGSALQQLEDPGAKVAGIVGQAIANIALGFAQATASSAGGGIFAWIAAIAGGMATMIATIASIKSATAGSYAEGGIVPGNNYNDGLIANVSSGELILNRSQQDRIAADLQNNENRQMGNALPYTTGENIVLGINNHFKRSGQGEIVTTGMLRNYGII